MLFIYLHVLQTSIKLFLRRRMYNKTAPETNRGRKSKKEESMERPVVKANSEIENKDPEVNKPLPLPAKPSKNDMVAASSTEISVEPK